MRIMVWTNAFWPQIGGVEVLGARLFPALKARGHEFLIVTRRISISVPGEAIYCGIPVYRFPTLQALNEGDVDQLAQIRQQMFKLKLNFRPDLIYFYHVGPDVFLYREIIQDHSIPVLATLHGTFPDQCFLSHTLIGEVLRSADWITACSAAVLDKTRQQLPEIVSSSSVIANSLEEPHVDPAPISFEAPKLLCVGRAVAQKGFDLVLIALASIIHRFPTLRLVIAGDGESLPELKQQAARLQINNHVEFMGWVIPEKIPALINESTMVVVPSREEPFGLVALQASQMARPVVASWVGGLSEIIVDTETGLLVEKEDVRTLADAIAFLLDHPKVAIGMGENGRKRTHEIFNWSLYVDAYDQLFHQLGQNVCSYESAD